MIFGKKTTEEEVYLTREEIERSYEEAKAKMEEELKKPLTPEEKKQIDEFHANVKLLTDSNDIDALYNDLCSCTDKVSRTWDVNTIALIAIVVSIYKLLFRDSTSMVYMGILILSSLGYNITMYISTRLFKRITYINLYRSELKDIKEGIAKLKTLKMVLDEMKSRDKVYLKEVKRFRVTLCISLVATILIALFHNSIKPVAGFSTSTWLITLFYYSNQVISDTLRVARLYCLYVDYERIN